MNHVVAGVYKITNTINGKVYVGSSADVKRRLQGHRYGLREGKHPNAHLQAAFRKYGESAFSFGVLQEVATILAPLMVEQKQALKPSLLYWEQEGINALQSHKSVSGYNNSPTAGSSMGVVFSPEVRQRMSNVMQGRMRGPENPFYHKKHTPETLQRLSATLKISMNRPETRAKLSAKQLGKPSWNKGKTADVDLRLVRTPESCAKQSVTVSGEHNHFFGKTHDEETRARMAAAVRASGMPERARARMLSDQNPTRRADVRAKISLAKRGVPTGPRTDEQKQHYREAALKREARRRELGVVCSYRHSPEQKEHHRKAALRRWATARVAEWT